MARAMHSSATHPGADLGAAIEGVRSNWGWFVALGVIMLLLGALAFSNILIATFASVIYIGVMMIVAAIAHIVEAFRVRRWGAFFLWLLSGLLYGAAGVLVFYNPALAVQALTLAVGFALVFAGGLRIGVGYQARPEVGWGWIVASGVMSVLVGVLVALGWPENTPYVLGLLFAIDLTFQGAALLGFGLTLRSSQKLGEVR